MTIRKMLDECEVPLEWPLDAPQPSTPEIRLAVASPSSANKIRILLTFGGPTEAFTMERTVAASLIAELARALASSA